MTNVLIAVGGLQFAGAEQQVRLLASHMPKDRFRVHVACFNADRKLLADTTNSNVSVHILPRPTRFIWPISVLRALMRIVRAEQIHVVHGFLPTFEILVPCLRLWKPALRVLSSRRNVDDSRSSREILCLRLTSVLASAIVANGEEVAESVRRLEKTRRHIDVIANGLPLPEPITDHEAASARVRFGLAPEDFVVAYVAHFREGKGYRYLPGVIEALSSRLPTLKVLVAGHIVGSETYRRNAQAFVEELDRRGIQDHVVVLGLQRDIRPVWAAADVALNLSDCEGMSNALMEAMALSRPVVATDAGAIRAMIEDGREGFIIPRGDISAAVRVLAEIAKRADLCRLMGDAGRCRIADEFSVERMVRRYATLYATPDLAVGAETSISQT